MAASITHGASRQACWTIRALVDRDRVADAYRAYGYFRWLDDRLDDHLGRLSDRRDLLSRQTALLDACYADRPLSATCPEERILIDLVRRNPERDGDLASYIEQMMQVMQFDSERRGRLITQAELESYQAALAGAVTDALHWFIGHDCPIPPRDLRYRAATGAHMAHMLRDAREDVLNGYFNIPVEVLDSEHMGPADFHRPGYREWVRQRVIDAQACFCDGTLYLRRVGSPRCRLAGFAYQERFVWLLRAIERHQFVLKRAYPTPRFSFRAINTLMATLASPALPWAPRLDQPTP